MKTIAHRKYEIGPKDFISSVGTLTTRGFIQMLGNPCDATFPSGEVFPLPFSTKLTDYKSISVWACWDGGSYSGDTEENGIATTERTVLCKDIPYYNSDDDYLLLNYSPITKQKFKITYFKGNVILMLVAMDMKQHVLHLEKVILSF